MAFTRRAKPPDTGLLHKLCYTGVFTEGVKGVKTFSATNEHECSQMGTNGLAVNDLTAPGMGLV